MFNRNKFHLQKIGQKPGKLNRLKNSLKNQIAIMRQRARHPNGKLDYKQIALWAGLGFVGLILFMILSLGLAIAVLSITLPDVHDLDKLNQAQATTIYDREGNVLYVKGAENREYVTYDKISPQLIDATLSIEDTQYWDHPGFNIKGIARAVVNDIFSLKLEQGGSTITQQYIKLAFLSTEKSYIRKLKELILAVQLEQAFDKKKILELYLNKISYGNGAYGIEKAAQIYFNKHAKDLDLAESAVLAGIPNRPGYYNQHHYSTLNKQFSTEDLEKRKIISQLDLYENEYSEGIIGRYVQIAPENPDHKIYIAGRSDVVLSRMKDLGVIDDSQKKAAQEKIQKIQFQKYQSKIKAPHFVMYILDQLADEFGSTVIEQGGLKVYTTLDPKMEEIAEKAVLEGSKSNEKAYNAKNAALISMDPKTGQILAMAGSRDYFDPNYDGNENVITDYRQPGSSFKPFVYAQVFMNRYAPASPVFDTPMKIGTDPNKYPKNFDGGFRGPMTIRSALGQSRNIPAIKAYFAAGQQQPIIELTQKMGLQFQELKSNPNHQYGYPLAIGAAGVRPLDMATAYSVFANNGVHHKPVSILKIENSKGDILRQWEDLPGEQVLDPQVAYLINSVLSDTTVRLSQNLTIPGHVNAAKTGTSNGFDLKPNGQKIYYPHDLWTMGYTSRLVTAVWVGNNNDKVDGHMSLAADGTNAAAPIWKKFMVESLKNTPPEDFPVPEGIQNIAVSKASGKLPGPNTPQDQIVNEVFASFSIPTEVDDGFTTVNLDKLCNGIATEYTPQDMIQVVSYRNIQDLFDNKDWLKSAQDWVLAHATDMNKDNTAVLFGTPPTNTCPEHNADAMAKQPKINITSPASGSIHAINTLIPITVQVTATTEIDRVEFYLDNEMHYRTNTAPFDGQVRLPFGETAGIQHTITAKVFDKLGYVGESSIIISVSDNGNKSEPKPIINIPTQINLNL